MEKLCFGKESKGFGLVRGARIGAWALACGNMPTIKGIQIPTKCKGFGLFGSIICELKVRLKVRCRNKGVENRNEFERVNVQYDGIEKRIVRSWKFGKI